MAKAIEFDPAKDAINTEKHGVSLAAASEFEIALVNEDTRKNYGEVRYRAFGFIDDVPHFLAFTVRQQENGPVVRAISLRKATRKEIERHDLTKK